MRIANDSMTVASAEAPISLGASFVSDGFYLGHIVNYSIQLVYTGTPDGTFTLECSNDKGVEDRTIGGWDARGVSNWTEIGGSASIVSGADSLVYDVQNAGYRWVRVRWTRNASTGSLTSVRCNAKGV